MASFFRLRFEYQDVTEKKIIIHFPKTNIQQ